jgi:NAD(P)-dependent dehydrogenase (short-subunit alcohol dehydrogenase family)
MSAGEFAGKTVIVTGGAQGIGKCLVQTFANEGAQVWFGDNNQRAGEHWEKSLREGGHDVFFVPTDFGDASQTESFAAKVLRSTKTVDLLINNVGVTGFGHKFGHRPVEEWKRMIDVGLTSHFLCAQLFRQALIAARGAIISIASTRALMSEPDSEPYSAAKGGILSLTHSLAITIGPDVRVNCISPGWIDVSGWSFPAAQEDLSEEAHRQHPVGRVGKPEDIAEACLFLGSNRRAGFITGQNLVVDGGMTKKMIYVE